MSATAVGLLQLALLVLALLLAGACAVGTTVVLRPTMLERLRRSGDAMLTRTGRALNAQHNADRWFYRRHRLYGASVAVLALVLLGYLTFGDPDDRWLSAVDPRYREVTGILALTARVVLWLFGVFALVIATIVFVRPSALKRLESVVNRWITPSRPLSGLEHEVRAPDRWVERHPRAWGATVALLSGLCLVALLLHAGSLIRLGM